MLCRTSALGSPWDTAILVCYAALQPWGRTSLFHSLSWPCDAGCLSWGLGDLEALSLPSGELLALGTECLAV